MGFVINTMRKIESAIIAEPVGHCLGHCLGRRN
jgi:hypothetical protein